MTPKPSLTGLAAQFANAAVPVKTRQARDLDWRQWSAWASARQVAFLPADPSRVADWLADMAAAGAAPASMDRRLATLGWAHRVTGSPLDQSPARQVLRGYRRQRAAQGRPNGRRAAPVRADDLRRMLDLANPKTPAGVRDRMLLLLLFATAARTGEVTALRIGDVLAHDAGMLIRFPVSKTDLNADGVVVAVPYGHDPATDPVLAMREWLAVLVREQITDPDQFIVRPITPNRLEVVKANRALSTVHLHALVKGYATRAKVAFTPGQSYLSPHSLRAGFATEAYCAGADMLAIARHGRWADRSAVLTGYIRDVDRWANNPLSLMRL